MSQTMRLYQPTLPFIDLDKGEAELNVSYAHRSTSRFDRKGFGSIPAYGLINMSLNWSDAMGSGVDLGLWVRNLADKNVEDAQFNFEDAAGFSSLMVGDPRTYGGKIAYRFGVDAGERAAPRASASAAAPMGCDARNFQVFFDWDRSDLTGAAAGIVSEAAAHINAGCSATIDVTGHTDASGGTQYNAGLSKKRADSVAQALVNQGVPAGQIAVNWKGESEPLVSTADGVREPQNRRVGINVKG